MDYLITFADKSQAYLTHYGVSGMEWGVQSEATKQKYASGNGGQYDASKKTPTITWEETKKKKKKKSALDKRDAKTSVNDRTKLAMRTKGELRDTGIDVTVGKDGKITNEEYRISTGEMKNNSFSKTKHTKNRTKEKTIKRSSKSAETYRKLKAAEQKARSSVTYHKLQDAEKKVRQSVAKASRSHASRGREAVVSRMTSKR